MTTTDILYQIRDLVVEYNTRAGVLTAVDHVSFDIHRGEVLGLVGESGCGKSTLGKALMRMIQEPGRITGGELWFDGVDLMQLSPGEMRKLRGSRISMIFQDPMTSLNPVQRVVEHITETIRVHEPHVSIKAARARAAELVDRLGINRNRLDDYPHQLSGGMRQRVMISLALALRADLVIADEATTSLDVIVEAQFLDLLKELREEFNLTILLITHSIGLVAELADRVAVMYAGRMAELADIHELFEQPQHPYTRGLLRAVPNIRLEDDELYKMPGSPPDLVSPPSGCRFHPRCPEASEICSRQAPTFHEHRPGHFINCWLYQEQEESVSLEASS
ncbi:MAG: ABC transporter ATP-binding protein [Anaerolineae bacterium]|nr:MAG: ABC transporter ATP-binding protein [Anaerolineae bacterium]